MKILIAARDPLMRSHLERVAKDRSHTVELLPAIADPKIYAQAQVIFAHTESIAAIRKHASAATFVCALTDKGEDPLPAIDAGADDWLEKASDATARFRAIEAKVNSSLVPALHASPDYVVIIDRSGRILFINRPGSDAIGHDAHDHVQPAHRRILSENIEKVFETGTPQRYEIAVENNWYESTIAPLVREGKVIAAMIVARDITDRRRVRDSEARFKSLIERMSDAILLHHNGKTVWVNDACVRGLGYDRAEEIIGKSVLDFIIEEDRQTVTERIARMQQTGEPEPGIELGVIRRDGTRATFELSPVHFVELDGEKVSLIVARDITQKKEMHERLLVSERLASMGSLAACMAHEINNPLTYVIGNLAYVARALAEELEDSSRSLRLEMALADAREGVERVRHIVSDLTALAQLETDEHRVCDLRKILESTVGVAHNEIKHRARLEKSYSETPYVNANEVRLGQLFLDLLLCAARGIPEGAANDNVIAVICGHDPSGKALLEVRCRSSNPMERAKDAAASLTLASRIVSGLNGELKIEHPTPREMVISVKLPAADGEPEEIPREKTPPAGIELPPRLPGARARILVVDDEPVIASTMRRALEGHDIYIVTSGRDALELCRGQAFDLVLCDLMMPDLTGMDLYEQLRRDAAGNEKRIIFMTGGAFTPRAKSFLAKIPNAWVEKPFDFDQIQSLVDEYIQATRSSS